MYIFITRCVCACNSQSLIKDWDEHHMVPMFGMTNTYGWSQGWSNPAEAGINIFQAWSLTFSQTRHENPANEHLDLQLALFSAHSSFYLDLHSFWISTLTWTRKRAFVSWRMGIYEYFPGKYTHNFSFKNAQSARVPKVVQLRSLEEKPFKKQLIIYFVFSRGCRHDYIWLVAKSPRQRGASSTLEGIFHGHLCLLNSMSKYYQKGNLFVWFANVSIIYHNMFLLTSTSLLVKFLALWRICFMSWRVSSLWCFLLG